MLICSRPGLARLHVLTGVRLLSQGPSLIQVLAVTFIFDGPSSLSAPCFQFLVILVLEESWALAHHLPMESQPRLYLWRFA
jgi:hypothetical protein